MTIYKLSAPQGPTSVLLEGIVTNRTVVTGDPILRQKFVTGVISAVTTEGTFMNRKASETGSVFMYLPRLGVAAEYSNLLPSAVDRDDISWTYSASDFLTEDLSKYALVVIEPLEDAFSRLRNEPAQRDIDFPSACSTARNLLVVSSTGAKVKSGMIMNSSAGETSVLSSLTNRVTVNLDAVTVDNANGSFKYATTGDVWKAPKLVEQKVADWAMETSSRKIDDGVVVNF